MPRVLPESCLQHRNHWLAFFSSSLVFQDIISKLIVWNHGNSYTRNAKYGCDNIEPAKGWIAVNSESDWIEREGDTDDHGVLCKSDHEEREEVPLYSSVLNCHFGVTPVFSHSKLPLLSAEVRVSEARSPNKYKDQCDCCSQILRGQRMTRPNYSIKWRQNGPIRINKPKRLLSQTNQVKADIDIQKEH